ncbi:MAG: ribonuclease III [Nitriliruptoraceae bacterium]
MPGEPLSRSTDGGPADRVVRPAADLTARLEVTFDDLDLLAQALVHRSWAFEQRLDHNNERLEFLGDAVLGLVVTDRIYRAHPDVAEGRLAKLRAAAVRAASLAAVARDLELGDFVLLGRGESASGGADKDSILADTLEAVIGAVYLDRGFAGAFDLVERLFSPSLEALAQVGAALDFKTSLQELVATMHDEPPLYDVVGDGPDHERTFEATVSVQGAVVGRGRGPSKKRAEQQAARQAYMALVEPSSDDA